MSDPVIVTLTPGPSLATSDPVPASVEITLTLTPALPVSTTAAGPGDPISITLYKGLIGAPGATGRIGDPGPPGRDGTTGADGRDGARGADGRGIAATAISATGRLLVTYTDNTTQDLGQITGVRANSSLSALDQNLLASGIYL